MSAPGESRKQMIDNTCDKPMVRVRYFRSLCQRHGIHVSLRECVFRIDDRASLGQDGEHTPVIPQARGESDSLRRPSRSLCIAKIASVCRQEVPPGNFSPNPSCIHRRMSRQTTLQKLWPRATRAQVNRPLWRIQRATAAQAIQSARLYLAISRFRESQREKGSSSHTAA